MKGRHWLIKQKARGTLSGRVRGCFQVLWVACWNILELREVRHLPGVWMFQPLPCSALLEDASCLALKRRAVDRKGPPTGRQAPVQSWAARPLTCRLHPQSGGRGCDLARPWFELRL